MALSNYITADEEAEIDYLADRYRRRDDDASYADLCRYVDSLYRKYKIKR